VWRTKTPDFFGSRRHAQTSLTYTRRDDMIEDSCAIFIYLTYSDLVSNFAAIRTCENFGGNAPTEVKHPINFCTCWGKDDQIKNIKAAWNRTWKYCVHHTREIPVRPRSIFVKFTISGILYPTLSSALRSMPNFTICHPSEAKKTKQSHASKLNAGSLICVWAILPLIIPNQVKRLGLWLCVC